MAQDFSVQIHAGGQWRPVFKRNDNRQTVAIVKLDPPARADQVRIGITRGSPSRPHLAAIAEIQVLAIEE